MKVEQTSDLIKAPDSTIQKLVNATVGMKINSQEIASVPLVALVRICLKNYKIKDLRLFAVRI
jgi:hypothetical protein